jgi:hypothetical protein
VGKSSFVRAGLVPALKASGEHWSRFTLRPGRSPMAALAHALTPMASSLSHTAGASAPAGELTESQLRERLYAEPGYLGTLLRARARSRDQHILLVIDQFEELYTQVSDPRERLAFTACLAGVCDDAASPLRLVLSLRSDFLDHVAESPALMAELTRSLFFLAPPNRDGLRDALLQPAEMAGYQFESPATIESMLDHLEHTPGALPLLQFAASQLWEMRDRDRRLLTADSYHRIGGIAGALASHADAVLAECSGREQALVRVLFLRLITPERTRAIVPVTELYELSPDPAELHRVVDRLVGSRLLVGQTSAAGEGGTVARGSVEIVHESLIQSWPMLRRWLDETQEDAAFLEQLRNAAKQWQAKGHAPYLLWRGEAMAEAKLWHSRYRGQLPELQRRYLSAVFALSARSARRKRLAIVGGMGVLGALVVAASIALVMIRDAQQEATTQARRAEAQLVQTQQAKAAATQAAAAATQAAATATQAEAEAKAERAKTLAANQTLENQNASLVTAIRAAQQARTESERARREAEQAGRRAELARRQEQKSQRLATAEAQRANKAAAEAKLANEKLAERLAEEQKRVQELETLSKGLKLVTDLSVH